jgi:hypothetical protein
LGTDEPRLRATGIWAFEGIIDKNQSWRDFAVSAEEKAGFRDGRGLAAAARRVRRLTSTADDPAC